VSENRVKLTGALEVVEDDQRKLLEALATANDDRARLRAALEAAAVEKAQLERQLHETERWLRHLEGSRSWRITRPIRAAGAAFRRLSQWRAAPPRRRV
jgi:septal ring factor EnvC (AmiA/AmiB activator)